MCATDRISQDRMTGYMIQLTAEEEKFILRIRQLTKAKMVDEVMVRLNDLAIVEKHSFQEEVFRPATGLTDTTKQ